MRHSCLKKRLIQFQNEISKQNLDGFLVPQRDENLTPIAPPHARRLTWLTGFSGSMGEAVITHNKAALFVDGRYLLQAPKEVLEEVEVHSIREPFYSQWMRDHFSSSCIIGYDPWLYSIGHLRRLKDMLDPMGIILRPGSPNPVDHLWDDQPSRPMDRVMLHNSGESTQKIKTIVTHLSSKGVKGLFITDPSILSWLLGIRGQDFSFTPLVQGYGILHESGKVTLFVTPSKVTPDVMGHFDDAVSVVPLEQMESVLNTFKNQSMWVDPQETPQAIALLLEQSEVKLFLERNPCLRLKAIKNHREIQGMKKAHLEDAIALNSFFAELSTLPLDGSWNEFSLSEKLTSYRKKRPDFFSLSFENIIGFRGNGAIIHYHATQDHARPLDQPGLLLVDSGAHYTCGGTTDVTKTTALGGNPTEEQRELYTRVLKGHIAVSSAIFPLGTRGVHLDSFARAPLWEIGMDYCHSTGHGVGAFLCVHESPPSIAYIDDGTILEPGMVVSNEPGLYKEGEFGIRIERLVLVTEHPTLRLNNQPMLRFETLTLVPFDRHLIETDLLIPSEIQWIDAYHKRIRETLSPHLDDDTKQWLYRATQPL